MASNQDQDPVRELYELRRQNERMQAKIAACSARLQKNTGIHLDRKEVAVMIVGLAPTLAGLVIEDVTVLALLMLISWIAVLYVCSIHEGSLKGRALFAILATLLYGGIGLRLRVRALEAKQEDVYSHLSIEMLTPYLVTSPPKILFIVKNGGGTLIVRHQDTCKFHKIIAEDNAGFVVPNGASNQWNSNPIEPFGDGQTDACFTSFMGFNFPVKCVDVTVNVRFEIDAQPGAIREKEWRFVATKALGQHWFQESPKKQGNYCDGSAES